MELAFHIERAFLNHRSVFQLAIKDFKQTGFICFFTTDDSDIVGFSHQVFGWNVHAESRVFFKNQLAFSDDVTKISVTEIYGWTPPSVVSAILRKVVFPRIDLVALGKY
jgi:hypothetical protein